MVSFSLFTNYNTYEPVEMISTIDDDTTLEDS